MKTIKIEWGGEKYTIREADAFELGEAIEDIMPLSALSTMAESPNFRRIARCYAEMLNFAGANVTPSEIHSEMMRQLKGASEVSRLELITVAISTLMEILMDGAPEDADDGAAGKKKEAA